jgi:hypothetical protein
MLAPSNSNDKVIVGDRRALVEEKYMQLARDAQVTHACWWKTSRRWSPKRK